LKAFIVILATLLALSNALNVSAQSTVMEHCQQLMTVVTPVATGPDAPSIRIVEPSDMGVVYGGQLGVTVETQNFDFSATGQHWHIWVNGQLMQMVYGPTAILDVAPGTHEICAIMGTAEHGDVGAPAAIRVTVVQPAPGTPTTTPPVAPEVAATYAQEEPGDGFSPVLLVGLGLLAAVGGWWMGTRMGKRRL
jgi:hypothetical protein